MRRLNPMDDLPHLWVLQIFHPQFPDYPLYSPPMTSKVVRQERVRLLEMNMAVVVQQVIPGAQVIGRVDLKDFD